MTDTKIPHHIKKSEISLGMALRLHGLEAEFAERGRGGATSESLLRWCRERLAGKAVAFPQCLKGLRAKHGCLGKRGGRR